jgi:hypothetical protein
MRTLVALVVSSCLALPAVAGTIFEVSPDQIQQGSVEVTIRVSGRDLGDKVAISGPAGDFNVLPTSASSSSLYVWVPEPVLSVPGKYSLIVYDDKSRSNEYIFEITPKPAYFPLIVNPHDPITREAESAKGAVVEFVVTAQGGRDPNPVVECDKKSGSVFPLGPNHVRCIASNKYGERAEGGLYIYVYDTGLPVIHVPSRIVVEAENENGTIVEYEASASDVVDGPVPVHCDPKSGSRFPIGVNRVVCTVSDSSGSFSSESFEIEVTTKAPEPRTLAIHVPANITAEAQSAEGSAVTFTVTADGTGDPSPAIVCQPASGTMFGIGNTLVKCTAEDRYGNVASAEFTVTVADTIGPMFTELTASPDVLEPPNSKLIAVEVSVTAIDLVDPAPRCEMGDITANQDVDGDIEVTGPFSLLLRSERDNGKERVYSIRVNCMDAAGNVSSGDVFVRVPQGSDQQDGSVIVPTQPPPSRRRSVGK